MQFLALLQLLITLPSSAASAPVITLCPPNGYTPGMPPKLIYKVNKTKKIVVCGSEEADKSSKKKKLVSEFAVYSVDAKGNFSSALREFASQDVYFLRPSKKGLLFEQVILLNNKWVPAFASTLNCKREFCTFSDDKCVFRAKGKKDAKILKEFQTYVSGSHQGEVPDETLVYRLVNSALFGDKEAQLFIVEPSPALRLEGSVAEDFNDAAVLIRRMKKAHCL